MNPDIIGRDIRPTYFASDISLSARPHQSFGVGEPFPNHCHPPSKYKPHTNGVRLWVERRYPLTSTHSEYRSLQVLPGPSRCFPFWQEVLACYVVNTNAEDDSGKKKCLPVLEDYYEFV